MHRAEQLGTTRVLAGMAETMSFPVSRLTHNHFWRA